MITAPNTQRPVFSNYGNTGQNTQNPSSLGRFRIPGGTSGKKPLSFEEAYPAAVEQTGEDYDSIMKGYKGILDTENPISSFLMNAYKNNAANPSINYSPVTPQNYNYQTSADTTSGIAGLKNLSETGGYSGSDIADLRSRGISPIRAVYANAMREMDRNKSLQGGYSPNFNAATSKMTRELSDQVAGATQNVNAGIAENVAAGRRSMAPAYASAASAESGRMGEFGRANTDTNNQFAQFNAGNKLNIDIANKNAENTALENMKNLDLSGKDTKFKALSGMNSIYGTTPALASTFGNQAAEAARLQESSNARTNQTGLNLISQFMNRPRAAPIQTRRPVNTQPTSSYGNLPPWAYNNNILSPAGRSI